jgi:hypothetical protein
MKKFLYFLFALAAISFTVTSCAEEEIAPSQELENGGGNFNPGGIG